MKIFGKVFKIKFMNALKEKMLILLLIEYMFKTLYQYSLEIIFTKF